ncbi:MAG TPA: LytR family transcriptional regulator [Bacillus bacterium]|nr:LytR family transcriptional regulator [Bacillus sp. (in: firmicutes)]
MAGLKKRKFTKVLLIILIPLLAVFIGMAAYVSYLASTAKTVVEGSQHKLDSRKFEEKSELRLQKVDPRVDNISILFLGIDDSSDHVFSKATRTDAMILATFNKKGKSVKMVSIPRDSRVELVGRGRMDKITHAHAFGGLDMTVNTVEKLFEIPVDYYVLLNFDAFIDIIDALDGIQIDVPFDIIEQNSHREKNKIKIKKGLQTLNGEQALAYARTRKYDGDVERGQRQQEILNAIINRGLSIRSVTKYGDVIESIGDNLTTNMSFDEMLAFHDYAYAGKHIDVEMLTLKGKPSRIEGLYYYLLDETNLQEVKTKLKQHLEWDGTEKADENEEGKTNL